LWSLQTEVKERKFVVKSEYNYSGWSSYTVSQSGCGIIIDTAN